MTWQPWHDDLQAALTALRAPCEAKWRSMPEVFFDADAPVGGFAWSPSTRWLPGLDDKPIDALALKHHFPVPDDYRAYLRAMHGTAPRRPGATFSPLDAGGNSSLIPATAAGFYSWEYDVADIGAAHERVIDGLLFDVVNNGLWLPEWGSRADDVGVLEAQLRAHVKAAPPLIPIFGHRHMLVVTDEGPNPVLSIHQSDVIVYGADILTYLETELGLRAGGHTDAGATTMLPRPSSMPRLGLELSAVPLWGALLTR